MTDCNLAKEGQGYWQQYVEIVGYAWITAAGLEQVSRMLDINVSHLRKCISAFLET
jgi:hypothetical protein